MNHVVLTREPLGLDAITNLVADDTCGAIPIFIGMTRNNFNSKKVLSLEYEAYEPMAVKEIHKICHELRSRWADIVNIAICHRLGLVKVGEASVIIAMSSPHRQSSLEATTHAIDELKRRVPIWKKEKYEDDGETWKENKECAWLNNTAKKPFENLDIPCQITNDEDLQNLVQISAPESEIERRIKSFVQKKRQEIDHNNTLEFMGRKYEAEKDSNEKVSCARTDSVILKQEHSKGHLRVRCARNTIGPQTRPDYLQALDKHMSKMKPNFNSTKLNNANQLNASIVERLYNVEDYLKIPVSEMKNIHERLKEIENKILSLESMSPEYKHFMNGQKMLPADSLKNMDIEKNVSSIAPKRKTYTINQLDDIISYYEKGYNSKENES